MIVLGIDPGTATTGFGILEKKGKQIKVLNYGCIITDPYFSDGERLKKINKEINNLIKKYNPDVISIESLYFFKNLKTAMPVSQAKGVILLAAANKKIPVFEFTPLQVKMAITGYGKAEKNQVQKMIKKILNLEEKPKDKNKRKDDASDALGIALCYLLSESKINLS
ncbi:MAG TPA: crossover junction endodeoxyribonuclease RuvC [Candidatus Pacearchaeota archaeon]|nr:crossover junction endodeoxyribonuclease RuvC [Candidatus Paceibacterota bacterium]HOK00829.1 crossover junction endodeoxyribonuclease RuvC [Candidatus Pacearchaeota archaeon]HOL90223.1 crossover junction endodeoxyribonuclease RuvC [Candidatus Pacearchaeota archaeon]HOW12848.1 crossover junction endodeoxyribonuclease RuvC [Candidatus Pacearchaeota archaeon]HPO68474.1 crossover junction endodeoxyribonuclease RuvC [Candidatus Pacearchaeota archaeon]